MKINVESVTSEKELHEVLAKNLEFPDFYGKNWDAFWDSITGLVEMPNELEFIGSAHLRSVLPEAYIKLSSSLAKLNQEFPELDCDVTSRMAECPRALSLQCAATENLLAGAPKFPQSAALCLIRFRVMYLEFEFRTELISIC